MDRVDCIDQFHDSELGDVYDLYNACNGATRDGLLDVDKLDELSAQEAEALDLTRLREVWRHTATGCLTCTKIVSALNRARVTLRAGADESRPEQAPAAQASQVETY